MNINKHLNKKIQTNLPDFELDVGMVFQKIYIICCPI